jgi:hypothetical protein
MSRRTRRTLLIVAAVLLLVVLAVFLRSKAPPEAARLLPESDGIVYANLAPFRAFLHKGLKPPAYEPEYKAFVDATGIDWERDLDQVAIALHRQPNPNGPNGPVAYSMVLVGRLTGQKLNTWLMSHAASTENYAARTIYGIPSEGRTVRVCQIGYDMVAISNTPSAEQIHSIIDRRRAGALPFSGSSLLDRHYHEVPLLAVAWGVGQIGLPFSERGAISLLGFELPLQADSTIVASAAPSLPLTATLHIEGSLKVRVEEIARNQAVAESQAANLSSIVALIREVSVPLGDSPANNALREMLGTAEVSRHGERVVLTATVSPTLFASQNAEKILSGSASSAEPAASK